MRILRAVLATLALALMPSMALAQGSLLQSGTWKPGHAPMYVGSGTSQAVVQDSGPASGGGSGLGLSEQLLVVRGTGTPPYANAGTGQYHTNWCDYDAPTTNATGYHFLCLGPNSNGAGLLAYGSVGSTPPLPLVFNVNGTAYQFPFSISGILGPGTTIVGDLACWNNTVGTLLKDCTVLPAGATATTQTTGDNTTKVATDAFVNASITSLLTTNNIWTGDNFFKDGRPWADVRAWGAVGDGSTDDTAAIQAAINAVQTNFGSGIVYIPPSNNIYCVKTPGGITITNPGMRIIGASAFGSSAIGACGVDTTVITMLGEFDDLEHIMVLGKGSNHDPGTFGASHSTVILTGNCVQCIVQHCNIFGGAVAIELDGGAADSLLFNNNISEAYGSGLVYMADAGFWLIRDKLDQQWPGGQPSPPLTINAWAASTSYTAGTVVSTQGWYIQYTGSGTSGSTAPTLKNYEIAFSDGTAVAQIALPQTPDYYALLLSGAHEVQADMLDMSGPFTAGIGMLTNSAFNPPKFFKCTNCVGGQNLRAVAYLHDGSGAYFTNPEFAGCLLANCANILATNNWAGDITINGGKIFASNDGIQLGSGQGFSITGTTISGETNAGIEVEPGVSFFSVVGVTLGAVGDAANGTGVLVHTGSSDHYNISLNICLNSTTCINDGGTGIHKTVSGNN